MKKTAIALFCTSLLFVPLNSNAANTSESKTQGHYAGLDLTVTQLRFYERKSSTVDPITTHVRPSYSGENLGVGLNYKYAFNFDGIFIAPGIVFEQNNTSVKGRGDEHNGTYRYGLRTDIKSRLAFKTDLGYDINNTFAPYLTAGYARIFYKTQSHTRVGSTHTTMLESSAVGDWFYGAGLKANYTDNISFNFEYNRHSFLAKAKVVDIAQYLSHHRVYLNIFKAGISYKF